jgi:hypothetical protein
MNLMSLVEPLSLIANEMVFSTITITAHLICRTLRLYHISGHNKYWVLPLPDDKATEYALGSTICDNFCSRKFIFSFLRCNDLKGENSKHTTNCTHSIKLKGQPLKDDIVILLFQIVPTEEKETEKNTPQIMPGFHTGKHMKNDVRRTVQPITVLIFPLIVA